MTWYANNVFAKGHRELENIFVREFPGAVYRVDNLQDHVWWKPEIVHGIPESGLLAVRPVSSGDPENDLREWYDEPIVPWNGFANFGEHENSLRVSPNLLGGADEEGAPSGHLPTTGFLKFIRNAAQKHAVPILYYQCFMWGGDTESEFAFVYVDGNEILYEFSGLSESGPKMRIHHSASDFEEQNGDVLIHALRHLGIELPTSYFVPHTRSFDWACHRVGSGGIFRKFIR